MNQLREDTRLPTDERVRVFGGRRILALDGTEPEAFATRGERIVASGSRAELLDRFPGGELIDLDGALVVPGFNDAHCHPSQAALARIRVDLTATQTPEDLREGLRARASAVPAGEWVVAQAFDERRPGMGAVDRAFLDSVSREHPVVVVHYTFHKAVANSRALEILGYRTPEDAPYGGQLMTNVDGELNGWLIERAWLDPWLPGSGRDSIVPVGEESAQVAALAEVNAELHAVGITSYCDAIVTPTEQDMYSAALSRGRLTPRVAMLLWHSYFDEASWTPSAAPEDRLRLAGVKLMLDGALSGGTCLCQQPYASATGRDNGLQIVSDEDFATTVRRVHAAGARVAVHANGDLAISKVLDAVESLPKPEKPINHRIEHCSIVDDRIIQRIIAAGVTPVPFGAFIHFHGEAIEAFYGTERAARACAHRSMLAAGLAVAGSSDFPLVPIDPLLAVQSMVTRRSRGGGVFGAGQRLSVAEALGVYTHGSAHATGEAAVKGRLTPGQLADFAVLDKDVTKIGAEELRDVAVRSTWVGGKCVYRDSS
ncbi:amidohydrolase [Amycolatopsis palatopharyngis]|uniref:amidohydrolase n=1 Tax=Amycolatopsis palatopharyngis TaxID=187982 RepID=UPI000E21E66C|nr:amidohydrolase [Amycolatopsis palatopharyngis]